MRITRRISNADYALPVGHLPRGTYPPSRATNPALAIPLWTVKPSQRRETYPRHGSLRPARDGGQYTLPGEFSIYSSRGRYSPSSASNALRCLYLIIIVVIISSAFVPIMLGSTSSHDATEYQCFTRSDCLSDLHKPVNRSTLRPLVKLVRFTDF